MHHDYAYSRYFLAKALLSASFSFPSPSLHLSFVYIYTHVLLARWPYVYYISTSTPTGDGSNFDTNLELLQKNVFSVEAVKGLDFAEDAAPVFDPFTRYIYVDGFGEDGTRCIEWVTTNTIKITDWVKTGNSVETFSDLKGGKIVINCVPPLDPPVLQLWGEEVSLGVAEGNPGSILVCTRETPG